MKNENGAKWLTVKRLRELLGGFDGSTCVVVNAVGNLQLIHPDEMQYVGFIDFAGEGSVEVDPPHD